MMKMTIAKLLLPLKQLARVTLVVSVFVLWAPLSAFSQQPSEAPFRPGEVVVAGAPAGLPAGLVALKYLPNANLTVVAAPRGGEQALVQGLRNQGRRAGVNRIATASATVNDPFYSFQWHFQKV